MSYNAVTLQRSIVTAMLAPTPEELQQQITANAQTIERLTTAVSQTNQGIDQLVVEFIRPSAQQAFANYERLARIEGIVEASATAIADLRDTTESTQQQIAATAEMISALGDSLEAFDQRLEETRALVADNGSQIAQDKVLQQQNTEAIAAMVAENQAFRESQQAQLAAIIGNGRRIRPIRTTSWLSFSCIAGEGTAVTTYSAVAPNKTR